MSNNINKEYLKGYLKYAVKNCIIAFDKLKEVNENLKKGMSLGSNINVNHFGDLNRIIQDYLIIRVSGLFDTWNKSYTEPVYSFENLFRENKNKEYEKIKNEDIIKYIKEKRNKFVAHFEQNQEFPDSNKILNSNLRELLEKLLEI
jgi:hypothetical protein